jgi:hypothetical protein
MARVARMACRCLRSRAISVVTGEDVTHKLVVARWWYGAPLSERRAASVGCEHGSILCS